MPDAFPASYASPADMTARFGLQELIGLAPLPESDALDACGPPVFTDDWPQADNQGEGDQPPAYDVERVATALDQASREADSYLAGLSSATWPATT